MSYTEFFVTWCVCSIAAFFGIRMWFRARDTKRRIAEADERARLRNEQFQAREAERNASALYGQGSRLSGLGQNRGASKYVPKRESTADLAAAQTPSPWSMSDASQSYNPPSHHSSSPISSYHGHGGSFDGGGASGDWGSSSSSSDSCSSSSSDSSSSSSDSGSCSSSSD